MYRNIRNKCIVELSSTKCSRVLFKPGRVLPGGQGHFLTFSCSGYSSARVKDHASTVTRWRRRGATSETFCSYMERADMFFMANNITKTSDGEAMIAANEAVRERKKAILLMEVGPEEYGTLVNLLAPKKAKDVPFKDILKKLEEQFNPTPLEIAESYKFGTRYQKENICEYIVALKNLTLHCNFGTFLDRAIATDLFVG